MLLNDVFRFTTQMCVLERGAVIVMTDDNCVVGLPNDEMFQSDQGRREGLLKAPQDLGLPLAVDATAAF